MDKDLIIKGKIIGTGKPLVCIPVTAVKKDEIIAQIKELGNEKVEMIEWRVDFFEEIDSMNSIRDVFDQIKDYVKDSILVYTYRSEKQGGTGKHDKDSIYDIHQVAAECGVADFIDIEYFASKNPKKEIAELQEKGAYIITSHHDFDETPGTEIISCLLEEMNHSGADVVKIALMPQNIYDVLTVLEVTAKFHEVFPEKPLITMSMGPLGSISRVAGEYFGSCVTFGCAKEASAPGQLPYKKLGKILEELHESIEV